VTLGGVLSDNKGINLPDADLSIPALTDKDVEDLKLGAELGVDWVAMSFVRSRDDLLLARHYLAREGSSAKLMAKIEKPGAVERFSEILREVDGIMVARGDLGVEMPPERVPQIQKRLIRACLEAGKPVVTATQMLESMIGSPTPTRAEASDVANAIYDGTDAVMLSAETAVGDYPVEAVRMMDRIARTSRPTSATSPTCASTPRARRHHRGRRLDGRVQHGPHAARAADRQLHLERQHRHPRRPQPPAAPILAITPSPVALPAAVDGVGRAAAPVRRHRRHRRDGPARRTEPGGRFASSGARPARAPAARFVITAGVPFGDARHDQHDPRGAR
jgi:hypothetical protein